MTINESIPNLVNICVDATEKGDIKGRYYHKYNQSASTFENAVMLFSKMEELFDALDYPQATTRPRDFLNNIIEEKKPVKKISPVLENAMVAKERGNVATFLVAVKTRANASWQGQVIWAEKESECTFRSMMELMILIDRAVNN